VKKRRLLSVLFVIIILVLTFLWDGKNKEVNSLVSDGSSESSLYYAENLETANQDNDGNIEKERNVSKALVTSEENIIKNNEVRENSIGEHSKDHTDNESFGEESNTINKEVFNPETLNKGIVNKETLGKEIPDKEIHDTGSSDKQRPDMETFNKEPSSKEALSKEDLNGNSHMEPKAEKERIIAEDAKNKENKDKYLTDPIPEGKPKPVEWQDTVINEENELTCTLSITCKSILNNMHLFNMDKLEVLPEDGVIYASQIVTFLEGESVFDLLLREVKENKIHMEFVMTPIYNSNYIEGINNLYEFDCGELSGWMYKVNEWFPNYGCSRYILKDKDVVEWVYTCDLGRDIGGGWAVTGGEK
jgi:nitrogen fixation-related uncharacterized protein